MKKQITGCLAALFFAILHAAAQPVAKTDLVVLLNELAAPPATVAQAFDRAYPGNHETQDVSAFYRPWIDKLEKGSLELQAASKEYYMKNPMGYQQPKPAPASKASPQQQAAMNAATAELMQKMVNDPAFAQKFSAMSEAEQQKYIVNLLADKGLKPVDGKPDSPEVLPEGSDVDWFGLANELSQKAMETAQWNDYVEMQTKYSEEHRSVDTWLTEEINKLPTFVYGEYVRDHDPERVKAVRLKAGEKHREIAGRMLKEATDLFEQRRQYLREQIGPFNEALKKVSYGANYAFGIHYQLVLSAQMMAFGELDALRHHAEGITVEAAKWESDYRRIQ